MTPYDAGIFYIMRERHGGGWPPIEVVKVSGWFTVRLLAHMFDKRPRDVAREVVERASLLEKGERLP